LSSHLISKNLKTKIFKTVILLAVLYGCETWSLTLREEQRLRVFQNLKGREMDHGKNYELHCFYSSPNIVRVIKSRRMRWAGHMACMEEGKGVYRVLVGGKVQDHWEDLGIGGRVTLS
jgi:hypothetical protein